MIDSCVRGNVSLFSQRNFVTRQLHAVEGSIKYCGSDWGLKSLESLSSETRKVQVSL